MLRYYYFAFIYFCSYNAHRAFEHIQIWVQIYDKKMDYANILVTKLFFNGIRALLMFF